MTIQFVIACGWTALEGYLLGSLLFGLVISKLFYHDDVRLHGSGNAGMTNVLRTYGKLPALLTTVGDVGKSFVAVHLGQLIFSSLMGAEPLVDPICGAYLAAIFCVIGHSRPVFFGFRGGKGILCAGVAALVVDWRIFAIAFPLFLIVFFATDFVADFFVPVAFFVVAFFVDAVFGFAFVLADFVVVFFTATFFGISNL